MYRNAQSLLEHRTRPQSSETNPQTPPNSEDEHDSAAGGVSYNSNHTNDKRQREDQGSPRKPSTKKKHRQGESPQPSPTGRLPLVTQSSLLLPAPRTQGYSSDQIFRALTNHSAPLPQSQTNLLLPHRFAPTPSSLLEAGEDLATCETENPNPAHGTSTQLSTTQDKLLELATMSTEGRVSQTPEPQGSQDTKPVAKPLKLINPANIPTRTLIPAVLQAIEGGSNTAAIEPIKGYHKALLNLLHDTPFSNENICRNAITKVLAEANIRGYILIPYTRFPTGHPQKKGIRYWILMTSELDTYERITTQKLWSTANGTFYADSLPLAPSDFIRQLNIKAVADDYHAQMILAMIVDRLPDETGDKVDQLKQLVYLHNDRLMRKTSDMDTDEDNEEETKTRLLRQALERGRITFHGPPDDKPSQDPVFNLYAPSPTSDPDQTEEWARLLRSEVDIPTLLGNSYAIQRSNDIRTCLICQDVTHDAHQCPYPKLAGYHSQVQLSENNGPDSGQNHRGRGRGKGRGGGRGGYSNPNRRGGKS
ncbi:hypothetical protein BKA70DRAFT_1418311 [Coprinopsis sp. MPI-PUGE-AT-0042]|nr:hypothetical protein BKA70DRAFT_1418311 [Coprinopsis sp. MPI-PUGE-AT-0042]